MLITVAICTWNQAKLLDMTLTEMAKLAIPNGVEWELLVVNNNCSDETDAVLERHQKLLPLRRLAEPTPGKTFAANLAVREARGELILWTDDDVMVDSNWMTTYCNAALDFPEAVFFAGTIDPWITQALPAWIKPHFKEMNAVYAVNQHGEENRPFAKGDAVIGANMGFRTDVLRRFPFSSRLGSRGDTILIGEETELWHRLSHAGYKGMWLGKAKVRHFIRPERLTKAYVARWYKGIGRSMVLRGYFQEGKTLLGYSRWALLQRCKHKLCAGFYLPFHGPRWFHSFRQAAILGGVLYELRQHTPLEEAPPSKIVLTDSPASTTRWDHQAVQQRT